MNLCPQKVRRKIGKNCRYHGYEQNKYTNPFMNSSSLGVFFFLIQILNIY